MPVTEVRESGVEILDTEVEFAEEADGVLIRTEEAVEIQVGESAGHPITTTVQHFAVASIEKEFEEDSMEAMMSGETEVDESAVFISNEEGEVGSGFVQVDGGDIDDAIERFESEHL